MLSVDRDKKNCYTLNTGNQKLPQLLRNETAKAKSAKREKEEKQTLKEHHQSLTNSNKSDTLKAEVAKRKDLKTSTSPFREDKKNNEQNVNFSTSFGLCDFFCLTKKIEKAAKIVKKGKRYRQDKIYPRYDFVIDQKDKKLNLLGNFFNNEQENIYKLCHELYNGTYKLKPYYGLVKPRGAGKKPRTILVPDPRDRIVFTWVLSEIKKKFTTLSKYNIFGSGTNKELKTVKDLLNVVAKESLLHVYILKIDIKEFFPSIDKNILLDEINKVIKNKFLLDIIIKSFYNKITLKKEKDRKHFREPNKKYGIPQGSAYSPLLANFYARGFDIWLKNNKYLAYRYLDDLLIFLPNPKLVELVFNHLKKISEERGLYFHNLNEYKDKTYSQKTNKPFEYLGVVINNGNLTIPEEKKRLFIEKIKTGLCKRDIIKKYNIEHISKAISVYIDGWSRYYSTVCPIDYNLVKKNINNELKQYYVSKLGNKLEEIDLRKYKLYL